MASPVLLGIDTGGTYTDAVLFSEQQGVIAKAKALTTRHDLAIGMAGAVDAVLLSAGTAPGDIAMVSLSTTLATNALVEGQGGRVGLVMIGFGPDDLKRDGLDHALGQDPVVFLAGGHDVHGGETPLDLDPLRQRIAALKDEVSSFAIAGYFAVRNPAHECRVRDLLLEATDLPVTCSHELSSKLGGPRRALTTVLNARLVSMIGRLIDACERFTTARGIAAPMMVVRGDGALMSAQDARLRPIETILSGPAASLVGARYLTGLDEALVSDIGGTTTDIAVLEGGRPRLDEQGATVGGYRTMVEAVAMRTFGLGGDSEVRIDERGLTARIDLGPRRVLPLGLAAHLHGDAVTTVLERQLRAPRAGRHDARLAVRTGLPDRFAAGLTAKEAELFDGIGDSPVALDDLITMTSQLALLDRLVARGLVHIAALTPSDAMLALGHQQQWDRRAAVLGLSLAARVKDGAGRPIVDGPEALAGRIFDRLVRRSAETLLGAALGDDGVAGIDPATSPIIDRALNRTRGIARFQVGLDRPLIALGASAPVYYPAIGALLSAEVHVPDDADVANAIGAVVGQVRASVTVFVTVPEEGRYVVQGEGEAAVCTNEETAIATARTRAEAGAIARARESGAVAPVVDVGVEIDGAEIEGRRTLIEARVTAIASGRPRFAS
ncbi:hydantoinase/oxoprolinase N-terminal domain-containing protein [Rhizobium halophytocola]|uniref:hydantoinase/oxoprolinase N-terminal domain-containing protein n=1 Tax=Rhizobium halophytocola TaxID=735519 RepID=UPI001AE67324